VGVDDAVTGVQDAHRAAHLPPARDRLLGVAWLAVDGAVELEHRVAPDHQGARLVGRDRDRLQLRQLERELRRRGRLHGLLVDPADDHLGSQSGIAQRLQPCG
jgi:hypothetical protein